MLLLYCFFLSFGAKHDSAGDAEIMAPSISLAMTDRNFQFSKLSASYILSSFHAAIHSDRQVTLK